jgi:ribose 5-phosphate isomerase B
MINKTKIYIGADHAGYEMKGEIKKFVEGLDFQIIDLGTFSTDSVDYPDIAREVSEKVIEIPNSVGILICGTGIGMSISANKLQGIRAAECVNETMAEFARKHNNANVLCMGARLIDAETAKKITQKFLETKFENEERHARRVEKMTKVWPK